MNLTVVVALGANALVAVAKSVAAALTGSASLVAEAAHSWADTGNEVLLLVADRRSRHRPDRAHPLGYGREAYVWSMFAALGLFAFGSAVSITHGVQELVNPEPAAHFAVGYVVLAVAFCLEGVSFLQALRQVRSEARRVRRDPLEHALETSDPTLRGVFAEDAAALVGLVLAFAGLLAHQLTGSPVPDALGSIAVGLLLGVVAVVLIDRNRRFLVGEAADERLTAGALGHLCSLPEVARVTYLHLEFVGPRQVFLVASVDLEGDVVESAVAPQLRRVEAACEAVPLVRKAVVTVAGPNEPSLPLPPAAHVR
ncbi:cation diffusion facilitator family transporter [Georgenia ruanii]|uniref:Cation diffusion facilitator family transporter n=1 Tax=Georgenia ruanii TaxID=348442 RepID=A0A7J9UTN6_9MICO|nr:cation diffusion facilitator family transporter [Georgenia ruanii]MPV87872.1 cation diffusion facilitator family transporter [Georgenia ruanii]